MSIQSEIERVRGNIASAYTAVTELGGEVPSAEAQNSGNLAQAVQSIPLGSQLVSLEVDQPPEKVDYTEGETFDPAGLALRAQFSNGALLHLIQPFPVQISFDPAGPLKIGVEHIVTKLVWDGVEKECLLPITVAGPPEFEAGVDWWGATLPSSGQWRTMAYGNGVFVALAYNSDKAVYSSDGIGWKEITLPCSDRWISVTYGDGKFVAVPYYDTRSIVYSSDGIDWKRSSLPSLNGWYGVGYGGGKFVAVSGTNNAAAYSTNGISWQATTLPASASWKTVVYGAGKFVVVGSGKLAYSVDGITWESVNKSIGYAVVYGNGKFVSVGSGSRVANYSTNGLEWTITQLPAAEPWAAIAYGDGKFVIVSSSNKAVYSSDGIDWKETTLPAIESWIAIAYGDGKFVAIANNSDKITYSSALGPPVERK